MNESSPAGRCPTCGAELPPNAPGGLCPKCLFLDASKPTETGASRPSPPPPLPSREAVAAAFPQLEIHELIGQGGMGCVFKARQPKLNRFVALKILPETLSLDPAFAARFAREAQALAALSHPNIVTIHDFGQAGGFFYLLMEFVDGVNLRQALRGGRFTPEQALIVRHDGRSRGWTTTLSRWITRLTRHRDSSGPGIECRRKPNRSRDQGQPVARAEQSAHRRICPMPLSCAVIEAKPMRAHGGGIGYDALNVFVRSPRTQSTPLQLTLSSNGECVCSIGEAAAPSIAAIVERGPKGQDLASVLLLRAWLDHRQVLAALKGRTHFKVDTTRSLAPIERADLPDTLSCLRYASATGEYP